MGTILEFLAELLAVTPNRSRDSFVSSMLNFMVVKLRELIWWLGGSVLDPQALDRIMLTTGVSSLSPNQSRVLTLFDSRNEISIQVIVEQLNISPLTARLILKRLLKLKLITRRRVGRKATYKLV